MKSFECGSLVPGCNWHTEAQDSAEVVRRAAEHLRSSHDEEVVRPSMIEAIKSRVHEKGEALH